MTIATLLVAVVAGLLGLWSPCGLSMLSTITPIGERGRDNRYASTAAWYVVGATLGGLTIGALVALPALAPLSSEAAALLVALAALVAMCSDGRVFGRSLPIHKRQVNERWLDHYRGWVYGIGFGWQIGTGVATYVMSAATYLLLVTPALLSPWLALVAWTTFGCTRGLTVLVTRDIRTPAQLTALHVRINDSSATIRYALVVAEGVLLTCAAATFGVIAAIVGSGVALAVVGASVRRSVAPAACAVGADVVRESLQHR
jgi:hypothetical protein